MCGVMAQVVDPLGSTIAWVQIPPKLKKNKEFMNLKFLISSSFF
jgi:hypothetical protein